MSGAPANEPVLSYAPGSPERAALRREIERQSAAPVSVPLQIGGEVCWGEKATPICAPHRHSLQLGEWAHASERDVSSAIDAALAARESWIRLGLEGRAAVFRRAAELLAGPFRQRLNAATLLGQSKTPHQAEIDAACELVDFFRFNTAYAERLLAGETLISPPGERNHLELRPLEGFVYAVTPFNFTSIAGNLPTAPALLGNVVLWKPSPHAMLAAHHIYELLREAGLPGGVINLVAGDADLVTNVALAHPAFAGLNFTGSTAVFRSLFRRIGERIEHYADFPRVVGETGGKNFIVAHASADLDALTTAIVRGGFEYQGQKCSAPSRLYVPRSIAATLERRVRDALSAIRVGDPADFSVFMGALIGRSAFDRVSSTIERARADTRCRLIHGGGASDAEGYFIEPTLIAVDDASHGLFREELFGPVVAWFVYDDDRFDDVLELCDRATPYALTGAVFARDRAVIQRANAALRQAAGNFYVNDKPTGAVVGQQPFGGARLSGTNDKAGSAQYLLRWASLRAVKENFNPPRDFLYPYLSSEP